MLSELHGQDRIHIDVHTSLGMRTSISDITKALSVITRDLHVIVAVSHDYMEQVIP
jgi:hypothetical protein